MRISQGLGVLSLLLAAGVGAEEVYYDYAPVSWVEPVTGSVASSSTCPPEPAPRDAVGDGGAGVAGMVEALEAFVRAPPATGCTGRRATGERVVAYRVGYVYAGEDYVRVLDHDPGNRIRVRVSVAARP